MVITLRASSAFFLILTLEGKRVRSNNPAFDCRISRSTFLPSRERIGRLAALFVAALRFFPECRQVDCDKVGLIRTCWLLVFGGRDALAQFRGRHFCRERLPGTPFINRSHGRKNFVLGQTFLQTLPLRSRKVYICTCSQRKVICGENGGVG